MAIDEVASLPADPSVLDNGVDTQLLGSSAAVISGPGFFSSLLYLFEAVAPADWAVLYLGASRLSLGRWRLRDVCGGRGDALLAALGSMTIAAMQGPGL